MATNKYFYLDKAGLTLYDSLIKSYVDPTIRDSIKFITFEPAGSGSGPIVGSNPTTIYFWRVTPTATPEVDAAYKVTLPDASTLMTKVASGTSGNIVQLDSNGQVVDANISASDILTNLGAGTANTIIIADASGDISRSSVLISDIIKKSTDSGATFTAGQWAIFDSSGNVKGLSATASNVAYDDTDTHQGWTNVQEAIEGLIESTGGDVASKTVYITTTSGGSSDPYAKRYGIYQGANGSSSSPVPGEKLGDIDIPKDMVVEEGSVVDITYSNGHLYDGITDVTEIIKGSDPATSADAGKYIKLVIANSASTVIYIKATDLVDIYTGGTTADGTISISASNEITFTLSQTVHGSLALADTSLQPVTTATADNIVTFDANGGIQDSGVSIGDVATGIEDVIAPAYNASSTYQKGDYVIYNGKLYECNGDNVTGTWDSTKWVLSRVMTSFQPIPNADISNLFA